jgi:hypothetical protein
MSFFKFSYLVFSVSILSIFSSCIPAVERSLLELASFVRSQSSRTSGRIFVTVSQLQGSGLTLSLNDSENLSISASGEVSFSTLISPGDTYAVTVKSQPTSPTQACSVSGGTGTLVSGDVKSIIVNCGEASYTLGGTISGLLGSGLVLTNNGSDTVSISADGSFAFTTTYTAGSTYSIAVSTAPAHPGQSCVITSGIGTFSSSNVTSISIACTTTARTVRVNVSGIASGNLVLLNNSFDSLTATSNGSYFFSSDVAIGGTYSVTINSSPSSHTCVLTSASGTIAGADATVTANCFSLLAQSPTNLSVLNTNQSIVFRFSAAVTSASCTLGAGNLTTGGTTSYTLSTTNLTDDTLTLSTSTAWNAASVSQAINCTSAAGNALASGSVTFRYTIPSGIKYVSDVSGNDANPGTIASPYKSIQRGIQASAPCGTPPCVVMVEDGTYDAENVGLGVTVVTIVNNIPIYGGYTAGSNFSSRNSSARLTVIQKSTPTDCGGALFSSQSPCRSVVVGAGVTNGTIVDGFKIIGPTTPNDTAAVSITTGKVILSNNTIQGGTGNNAAGIFMNDFGGSSSGDTTMGALVGNTITGGSCTPVSCQTAGIFYYSTSAGLFPYIQAGSITGGSCSSNGCKTYGFYLNTGNATDLSLIRSNSITGGTISPLPGGSESVGIYLASASLTGKITGNSINGGIADVTVGVHMSVNIPSFSVGDNATKNGNAIYGGSGGASSYGVRMSAGGNLYSNSIHAGNISTSSIATTYGVYSASGAIAINGNRVFGGNSTGTGTSFSSSYGVHILAPASGSSLVANHISAGNSSNTGTNNSYTYGAYFSSTSSTPLNIFNNMIDGGVCSLSNSTYSCSSHGLVLNLNTIATGISYNTIYSGVAEDSSTPLRFQSSSSQNGNVQNNILYTETGATTRICLLHDGSSEAGNLINLKGNVFYGCPILVKFPTTSADNICAGGVVSDSGCSVNTISTPSSLNVYVNPVQSITTTTYSMKYRSYSADSPCTATRILNSLGTPTIDSLGISRPGSVAGVSAGALEYDGSCK